MQNIKEFKRGEVLITEGQNIENVYIIQSGRVQLFLERSGKKIPFEQVANSHIVGENAVFGPPRATYSAEVILNAKVLEIPVKLLKTMSEGASPGVKLLLKSLFEGTKQARAEIKSIKMETDASPLPQMIIPKLFSLYVLLTQHLGKEVEVEVEVPLSAEELEEQAHNNEGEDALPETKMEKRKYWQISWQSLKIYANRIFLESPQRIQNGLELLQKLDYVEMKVIKNDEGEEELSEILFKDIQSVEDFGEFYQYHLYKPGRSEQIYIDEMAYKIIKMLVELGKDKELNHKGAVELNYEELLKTAKENYRLDLKNTHWDLLEKKGLFVVRKSTDDATLFMFDREEFEMIYQNWTILREIDKWNEKGFIDLKEEVDETLAGDGSKCLECNGEITAEQKFCHHCGHKLAA